MKLWERSLFLRILKTNFSILFALFTVYLLLDLSVHGVRFFSTTPNISSLFFYYIHSFTIRIDFFFSLSFLLSSLLILFQGTTHFEFIALQMSGLSKTVLSRPFFFCAFLCLLISYANFEWVYPYSFSSISSFRDQHAKKRKSVVREHLHTAPLEDGSELLYADHNPTHLADVYWIKPNDLWHIKFLSSSSAYFVEHFSYTDKGLHFLESFPEKIFPELAHLPLSQFAPPDQRSLSTLFTQSLTSLSDKHLIQAYLHHKLTLPLTPLFIAFFLPRFLLRFSRTRSHFLVTTTCLLLLLSFLTILDGMLILAENHMLPPALALWGPWFLLIFLARNYSKN